MSEIPLPSVWAKPIGDTALWDPPVVHADVVVVRTGAELRAFDSATGASKWTVDLGSNDVGGRLLGIAGATWFADVTLPDRASAIIGVRDGTVAWRYPVGGAVQRHGACVSSGALHVLVASPNADSTLHRIDPATGKSTTRTLHARGSMLVPHGDALIAVSPTATDGSPGAYVIGKDGSPERVLRTNDVWSATTYGDLLASAGARKKLSGYTLEVCKPTTGELLWRRDVFESAVALGGADLVHATGTATSAQISLCEASTGVVKWTAEVGPMEPVSLAFAPNLVVCRHMMGVAFLDRRDGTLIGASLGGEWAFGVASKPGRVFIAGDEHLTCARTPA